MRLRVVAVVAPVAIGLAAIQHPAPGSALRPGMVLVYASAGTNTPWFIDSVSHDATAGADRGCIRQRLRFVTVDGRQSNSAGASLDELARIMARLGCYDAINVDGGGSSTFNLWGTTYNRPSDGIERPIANGVLFFAEPETARESQAAIRGPSKVRTGSSPTQYELIGEDGVPVSNAEVFWSASGPGWIDQGGGLRGDKPGTVIIAGFYKGQTVLLPVTIEPARESGME